MTVAAADLRVPLGEVDGALFYPGVLDADVTAKLTAYLEQGYAAATEFGITDAGVADAMATNFAYVRVWTDVVRRLTMAPASTSLAGEVSTTRLQSQIEMWIQERDKWLARYEALIPASKLGAVARGVSRSLTTEIVF